MTCGVMQPTVYLMSLVFLTENVPDPKVEETYVMQMNYLTPVK